MQNTNQAEFFQFVANSMRERNEKTNDDKMELLIETVEKLVTVNEQQSKREAFLLCILGALDKKFEKRNEELYRIIAHQNEVISELQNNDRMLIQKLQPTQANIPKVVKPEIAFKKAFDFLNLGQNLGQEILTTKEDFSIPIHRTPKNKVPKEEPQKLDTRRVRVSSTEELHFLTEKLKELGIPFEVKIEDN